MASEPSPSATVSPPPSKRRQAACGTDSGYNAHLRRSEDLRPLQEGPRRQGPRPERHQARREAKGASGAGAGKRSGRVRVPDPAANAAFVAALAAEVDRAARRARRHHRRVVGCVVRPASSSGGPGASAHPERRVRSRAPPPRPPLPRERPELRTHIGGRRDSLSSQRACAKPQQSWSP